MPKRHIREVALVLGLVLFAPTLPAQQPDFEVIVSGRLHSGCGMLPFSMPSWEWLSPDGSGPRLTPADSIYLASAAGQPVFATVDTDIVKIGPDLTPIPFAQGNYADLAVTSAGKVFAISGSSVSRISASGAVEATHALPASAVAPMIAVASDGCTLYYPKHDSIGRIDGCSGAPLADFAPIDSESLLDIEPLPNGNVLVATGDLVHLYDASGTMVRLVADIANYGFGPQDYVDADEVAVSPDGQSLWLAVTTGCDGGSYLIRAALSDERELSRRPMDLNDANNLVIGAATPAEIPAAGTTALVTLALLLGLGGALLLRR